MASKTTTDTGPSSGKADFYRQLRSKIQTWADRKEIDPSYRDYILLVPDLFHFFCHATLDPRVATRDKLMLGVATAYVLSPIDPLPDFLGPIGLVDDLIVMVIVLDSVLQRIDPAVVEDHWAGSADLFKVTKDALRQADEWVGKGLFKKLKDFLKSQTTSEPPPVPATPPAREEKVAEEPAEAPAPKARRARTPSQRPAKKVAKKKTGKKKVVKKVAKKKSTTATRTIGARKSRSRDEPRS
ncbi:MAG: DUF1232 domain-containing protein [Acidobacteriota bacterium]